MAEALEALRSPDQGPLVVIAGPPGFEIGRAHDEIFRVWQKVRAGTDTPAPTTFTVSLDDSSSAHFHDVVPAQSTWRGKPGSILFMKDLQCLSAEALPSFDHLIRQLAGTKTFCVASVSLPIPPENRQAFSSAYERLRSDGLARAVTLRPSRRSEFQAELTASLDAKPEPALTERTWQLTRGWPAAVGESMRISNDHDMVRVVDRHAFLTPWHGYPRLTDADEVVRWLRRKGTLLWNAAKAVAVLDPLGPALPTVLGEAVGVPRPDAIDLLRQFQHMGLLRYHRTEAAWRFRIPLVGAALRAVPGPYERRRLAKIAVDALWAGTAHCADPGYLPDQLANAGKLVETERARRELLSHASQGSRVGSRQTIAWLRAAADLAGRTERARILMLHAGTCLAHGLADLALESSGLLLSSATDNLSDEELISVGLTHVGALYETKDLDTLGTITRGEWSPVSRGRVEQDILRALALSLLGRWRETHDLLHSVRQEPGAEAYRRHINFISPPADLFLGLTAEFDREVASLPSRVAQGERPIGELICHTRALLTLGELARAEKLLSDTREVSAPIGVPAQMARAFYRGEFDESLTLARNNIATSSAHGCDSSQSVMFSLATLLQLTRGKLTRGRELLATAYSRQPTLPHVLAGPEAWLAIVFSEHDRARSVLLSALGRAEEDGIVAQTDALWICLAEIAVLTGTGQEHIPECMHRLDKVADQIGTEAAEIHRLSLRAYVDSDSGAAEAALALLRRRGQPFEQAVGFERLVRFGAADPSLLTEAYDRYGTFRALMPRAWLRPLMQKHGVPVPGRQATVTENENLLAVLVAEGLSNKQIALVLQTSDKSVEGRLSRLFSRTGYQSRVELAAAMLTGRFEADA